MTHKQFDHILVADFEATCWEGKPPAGEEREIIEIGYCFLYLDGFTLSEPQSILIRPVRSCISPFCTQLTTLTQQQLEQGGMVFPEACRYLIDTFKTDRYTWASFGEHDANLLLNQCVTDSAQYPFHLTYHINVRLLTTVALALHQQPGLMNALQRLGLSFQGNQHRAGDDAWNTAQLLAALLRNMRAIPK